MPINAQSYKNGKVYRIWTLLSNEIYIGSTADTLSNRFGKHRRQYKGWLRNKKKYMTSFELFEKFGVENCKIDLEHNFPCNSRAELNAEEGRVQRMHKDILVNNKIAGRTKKEYYADNKEHIGGQHKQYYIEHKEHLAEQHKQYQDKNKEHLSKHYKQKFSCECGGKYTPSSKSRHINTAKHQKFITDSQSSAVAC